MSKILHRGYSNFVQNFLVKGFHGFSQGFVTKFLAFITSFTHVLKRSILLILIYSYLSRLKITTFSKPDELKNNNTICVLQHGNDYYNQQFDGDILMMFF